MAHLVRAMDPLGVISEYSYEGLRLTERRAGENIAGYGYDDQDNIARVTAGHVTQANMTIWAGSERCFLRMRGQGSRAMRQRGTF